MKILQITDIGYLGGGAEASMYAISTELRKKGHKVKIFTSDLGPKQTYSDYTFKSIPQTPLKLIHHLFYWNSFVTMKNIIREYKPDLIHIHTISLFSPSVFFALGSVPTIMTMHGPEEFTLQLLPWLLEPSDYKIPSFNLKYLTLKGRLRYCYHRYLQRPLYILGLRNIKKFLVPSKYIGEAVKCDISKQKITHLVNGIYLKAKKPQPYNDRLLFVGRIEKVKGVQYLIEAFSIILKYVPEATLHIAGDGRDYELLHKYVATLGIHNQVTFTGWLNADQVSKEYEEASIVVIPSIWPENQPTVCLEAFAIGRPVIATNTGGIPELVDEGKTGYIVPPNDSLSIAKTTIKLLKNKDLIKSMSSAARESAMKYDMGLFIKNINSIYEQIIHEHPNH